MGAGSCWKFWPQGQTSYQSQESVLYTGEEKNYIPDAIQNSTIRGKLCLRIPVKLVGNLSLISVGFGSDPKLGNHISLRTKVVWVQNLIFLWINPSPLKKKLPLFPCHLCFRPYSSKHSQWFALLSMLSYSPLDQKGGECADYLILKGDLREVSPSI